MKNRHWVSLTLCALASAPVMAGETLVVIEHPDHESVVSAQPNQDKLGNLIVFRNSVFDGSEKKQIGTDNGYCVRVSVGESYECTWTLTLPAGQIVVAGPYKDKGDSVLAITGGTGKYAGARGSMNLHPRDAQSSSFEFRYTLM